jgi:hypothetical protein
MSSPVSVYLPYIKPGLPTGRSLDKFPSLSSTNSIENTAANILALHQTRVAHWSQSRQVSACCIVAHLYIVAEWKCQVQCRYTCPTSNQGCPLVAVSTSFPPLALTCLHRQYCCKYTCPTSNQGCPLVAVSTSFCLLYCSLLVYS